MRLDRKDRKNGRNKNVSNSINFWGLLFTPYHPVCLVWIDCSCVCVIDGRYNAYNLLIITVFAFKLHNSTCKSSVGLMWNLERTIWSVNLPFVLEIYKMKKKKTQISIQFVCLVRFSHDEHDFSERTLFCQTRRFVSFICFSFLFAQIPLELSCGREHHMGNA